MARRTNVTCLKGDERTIEYRDWSHWLKSLGDLVLRFDREVYDDPLGYNETASVSLLASAAAHAGYLGLAEFYTTKGQRHDRRFAAQGRCDFWMASDARSWGFEFKQRTPKRLTPAIPLRAMEEAHDCARSLRRTEANSRVAGLIISLANIDPDDLDDARDDMRAFAQDRDFAWELRGEGFSTDTFLFFDLLP
ncbi:MAG: hypothetical protein J7521_07705 [Caulobacter sp.]|nr:hypothetical protein [Caulobacter sp.]